jgi:hypothetical protein
VTEGACGTYNSVSIGGRDVGMGTLTNPEAFIGVVNFQNLGNDKVRRHAIWLFSLEWNFLVVVRMRFGAIGFGAHLVLLGRVCFLTWSTGSVLLAHFNTSRSPEDRYSAEGLVDWLGFAVTWTGTELSICSINRRTDVLPFCRTRRARILSNTPC